MMQVVFQERIQKQVKNCTAAFLTQEGKSDAGNNITGHV